MRTYFKPSKRNAGISVFLCEEEGVGRMVLAYVGEDTDMVYEEMIMEPAGEQDGTWIILERDLDTIHDYEMKSEEEAMRWCVKNADYLIKKYYNGWRRKHNA